LQGFELGRTLFYDGRLCKDGNFPCASCHQQFTAFATYDHNLSHGYDNSFTTRNAPALQNLAWQKAFMWDGGINHLDAQPLAPITAPNEMAETVENIIKKLSAAAEYRAMFKAAFGSPQITTQRIMQALNQFEVMLVSSNSKYDKVMRGEAQFNLPESLGYAIFKQKCASCHAEPFFTDFSYRNNGMPMDAVLKDEGRMKITGNPSGSLKFKVPSLRNVAVTEPYGHDGRFFFLINVFDHYRKNMVVGPTTDRLLKNKLPLFNYEIGQLTAFLYTLTDTTFLKNPRFAPPNFNNQPPAEHVL
jgi:cytochrome c peroxidase